MRKYKINYAEINSCNAEELFAMIECVCRYANFSKFPCIEDVLAILGIIPMDEKSEEPFTENVVEDILFGKKAEE